MKADQFNQIAENRIEHCRKTLLFKGEEYSRGGDRLHNFRSAAAIDNETPERAIWGMMKKHIVSMRDMISDIYQGIVPTESMRDEKITDLINYALLLDGLLCERLDEPALMVQSAQQLAQRYGDVVRIPSIMSAAEEWRELPANACGNLCRKPA